MMSKTSEIYKELDSEIKTGNFGVRSDVSREYICANGIKLIYSVTVVSAARTLSIPVNGTSKSAKFPIWKGVRINIVAIPEYGGNEQAYIALQQVPGTESYIFEIVAEDLRRGLEALSDERKAAPAVQKILKKWKDFFSAGRLPVLPSLEAQGLFGELIFLKEMLESFGTDCVSNWEGGRSTHDYYVGQNAVEIKTCSTQIPYEVYINSAHQLDGADVNGRLFLRVYALRKDHTGGIKLPQIIKSIRENLNADPISLETFNDKLLNLGYFDSAEDFYKEGYTVREKYSFEVRNGFPKITVKNIPYGISKVQYVLSVGACMDFAVDSDEMMRGLKS